jgi:surface antigen
MFARASLLLLLSLSGLAVSANAETAVEIERNSGGGETLEPYLQCVPYARQVSGIRIFGDAHTWWDQAEGHYARGRLPRVGAVMAFSPHGNMRLGHVAAVSRIIDSRTVLLRHANWSEIDGRRGQIEDNVRAIDVSPDNDWSEVRVWYAPIEGLGTTHWPVRGFIYNQSPGYGPTTTVTVASRGSDDPIGEIIARRLRIASAR